MSIARKRVQHIAKKEGLLGHGPLGRRKHFRDQNVILCTLRELTIGVWRNASYVHDETKPFAEVKHFFACKLSSD